MLRLTLAAIAAAALLTIGITFQESGTATDLRQVSISEASALYGAGCSGWDDDGDGCGTGGCTAQGSEYSPSSFWHYAYGQLESSYCAGGTGGSCGVFENVNQTACDES
ncbi:hypothetical protein Mal15_59840 [Stieleria maiorica]|uniref:Uncharacterized protein n=1 Tax=Stieleria maiorica TaxID=2795974 RepID=A0A5B9MKT4_9BACT|nr:hypothetical protein [Stieleria maiorica]QEG01903.1 hypothetical protein Mal15_59840 [Stieleria maiorica]